MSDPEDDAITEEKLAGTAPAAAPAVRNAFTELMSSRKPGSGPVPPPRGRPPPPLAGRDALGAFLADPASCPPSVVVCFNDSFVAVRDKYPKASVHVLLLPRNAARSRQHPFDAFSDAGFLAETRREAARLKSLAAAELRREVGSESRGDAGRRAALEGGGEDEKLPRGRDWEGEIRVGVHAHPSMNHLHVHVVSRDMASEAMRHRKHYNSFNTPFFVDLDDLPLAADDPRRTTHGYLARDLRCWRCGRNFGNKFKQLKEHLAAEFDEWRRE